MKKPKARKRIQRHWFSAQLRFVSLVEKRGGNMIDDSIVVFRATSFYTAFRHALKIGKAREHEYLNVYGKQVRWKLQEIVTLDIIREKSIDGAEVWSRLDILKGKNVVSLDAKLEPEKSQPAQTF
jgi:hypothetical protein